MVDLLVDLLLLLLFLGRGGFDAILRSMCCEVQMRREWWNHEKIKQKWGAPARWSNKWQQV